jgi:hypothetical protein
MHQLQAPDIALNRMRKWCVPAKPMTALLNPLVFVVVVAPYVVHQNLICFFAITFAFH